MQGKRLLSLALAMAVLITTIFTAVPSFADEKKPTAEDFEIIPVEGEYSYYNCFSDGLASVSQNGKSGYIDRNGKLVIEPEYDRAYNFHGGLAVVIKNEKYGLIDNVGKVVLPIEYSNILNCNSNLHFFLKFYLPRKSIGP